MKATLCMLLVQVLYYIHIMCICDYESKVMHVVGSGTSLHTHDVYMKAMLCMLLVQVLYYIHMVCVCVYEGNVIPVVGSGTSCGFLKWMF